MLPSRCWRLVTSNHPKDQRQQSSKGSNQQSSKGHQQSSKGSKAFDPILPSSRMNPLPCLIRQVPNCTSAITCASDVLPNQYCTLQEPSKAQHVCVTSEMGGSIVRTAKSCCKRRRCKRTDGWHPHAECDGDHIVTTLTLLALNQTELSKLEFFATPLITHLADPRVESLGASGADSDDRSGHHAPLSGTCLV